MIVGEKGIFFGAMCFLLLTSMLECLLIHLPCVMSPSIHPIFSPFTATYAPDTTPFLILLSLILLILSLPLLTHILRVHFHHRFIPHLLSHSLTTL